MTTPWPPVIGAAHVAWWARLRDIIVTLAAWLLLAYLLMPMIGALWSDMKVVLGLSPPGAMPALERLWQDLRPFLGLVALLMLWMFCYAVVRHVVLKRRLRAPPPSPPLERNTHLQAMELDEAAAEQLHRARIAVVEFDAGFRIALVSTSQAVQERSSRPR